MFRHIIVEGPDGSGKSGMVDRLLRDLNMTLHHRAATSLGGPLPDITQWHESDMVNLEAANANTYGPWVYDRHPLISERIYSMHARHVPPQGMFANPEWVENQLERMANWCVMVWCLPPKSHVFSNVNKNASEQMPGVVNNIADIYRAYARGASRWPGKAVWWDYTHMSYLPWLNELRQTMRTSLKGLDSGTELHQRVIR
jgi:hypothetical protein